MELSALWDNSPKAQWMRRTTNSVVTVAMLPKGGGIIKKDDECYAYLSMDDLHTHYRECED